MEGGQKDIALKNPDPAVPQLQDTNPPSDKKQVTVTGLPQVVQGKPLSFTLVAFRNAIQKDSPSNPVQIAPAPDLSALAATPRNASVVLGWVEPANTSSSPITGYDVYQSTDGVSFSKDNNILSFHNRHLHIHGNRINKWHQIYF